MLAIAGGKGGSGKTTVTLGLAAALARQRRRPLAVDADVDMPNLHVLANVDADSGLDALASGRPPDAVARPSRRLGGVQVVPASPGADAGAALRALADRDTPTLVDTAAGAGQAVAASLREADAAVVVTTAAPPAVEDALKTAAMARALDAPVAGVVINRAQAVPGGVADAFDAPTTVAVPRVDDPLADARARAAFDRLVEAWYPTKRPDVLTVEGERRR